MPDLVAIGADPTRSLGRVAQLPFHFADPLDPRIAEFERRTAGAGYSPEVLGNSRPVATGSIEAEDRLAIVHQPILLQAGRFDTT